MGFTATLVLGAGFLLTRYLCCGLSDHGPAVRNGVLGTTSGGWCPLVLEAALVALVPFSLPTFPFVLCSHQP